MATFATDTNLKEYEPDIHKYGIQDFSDLHSKTYDDIIRLLNIRWWPTANYSGGDITIAGSSTKLTKRTTSRISILLSPFKSPA